MKLSPGLLACIDYIEINEGKLQRKVECFQEVLVKSSSYCINPPLAVDGSKLVSICSAKSIRSCLLLRGCGEESSSISMAEHAKDSSQWTQVGVGERNKNRERIEVRWIDPGEFVAAIHVASWSRISFLRSYKGRCFSYDIFQLFKTKRLWQGFCSLPFGEWRVPTIFGSLDS